MGIDVHLKTEQGDVLASAFDPGMDLSRFAVTSTALESPLLRFLDRYGDLVLNRSQAIALLEELAGIIPQQSGPLKALLEQVRTFAERSEKEVHLYLWFQGD